MVLMLMGDVLQEKEQLRSENIDVLNPRSGVLRYVHRRELKLSISLKRETREGQTLIGDKPADALVPSCNVIF